MGSKKSCKFNTQISFFFGDIKLMSFQRNYRLITYEECYDRLIGLARDYLTPKFIFLTTKPACRSLNRVQRERDGERAELPSMSTWRVYFICRDLLWPRKCITPSPTQMLKSTWWSSCLIGYNLISMQFDEEEHSMKSLLNWYSSSSAFIIFYHFNVAFLFVSIYSCLHHI